MRLSLTGRPLRKRLISASAGHAEAGIYFQSGAHETREGQPARLPLNLENPPTGWPRDGKQVNVL